MPGLRELLTDPAPSRPVITAECPVIDGGGLGEIASHVTRIAPYADAINATDNTAARAHASNVAVAIALKHLGVEPVLQVVCRDKNRLALQADIMGAAMHGVTTVSCLTGDDVTAGDEPETRRVFDMDAPQLIHAASGLNRGTYLSGRKIDPAPQLFIGAVENPGAPPFAYRVRRGLKKAAAGARFLQLQICYHSDRLAEFTQLAESTGLNRKTALLPSIALVGGAKALRYMDANVPGIHVPQTVVERVENSSDPREAAYQLALEQAREALTMPGVRGLHITDFRRDDTLGRLCSDLGLPTVRSAPEENALAV
ncbi:methylenetetrahydrofolate reductase (NADPH) [Haloactinospora alba]|uniref:Methylenetetrahydrofolate reductase n=1 Tax=Haloactinospora alba TaxID=405555 RepID=A0A543NK45_9ACTN|nr:methylenetetrahydrofolate reductase [Haloactinospora alba]TQN32172.1 methylenetetrahydrofolate reductase (NADPH) [Haloactinospora alba]